MLLLKDFPTLSNEAGLLTWWSFVGSSQTSECQVVEHVPDVLTVGNATMGVGAAWRTCSFWCSQSGEQKGLQVQLGMMRTL